MNELSCGAMRHRFNFVMAIVRAAKPSSTVQKQFNHFRFLSLVLVLIPTLARAQTSPADFRSETIRFTNPAVGFAAEIEGLLQCPSTPGKHPLVVFIHGSGQGTRFEYDNLFQLFLNKGFAVFSYDKRGVGKSSGTYNGVGPKNSPMMIPLLASDAYQAIETVRNRPNIDSTSIILFGASQAGWIIPVVASMTSSVSHFVILCGPTVTVGEEIYYSQLAETGNVGIAEAENRMKAYAGLRGFDPYPYIATQKQKGLWIFGAMDHSVPTATSIQLLNSLTPSVKRRNTIKLYPQVGHGLRNPDTGTFENYEPYMFDWLETNVARK